MEPTLLAILDSLNESQRQAVCAPSSGQVQIIAGPGTGKTKVLTSRVAYLLLHEGMKPEQIIVTTFTKKATTEMVERLHAILHTTTIDLSKLLIGTFHSICFRILKAYGHLAGFADFKIADERDTTKLLQRILMEEDSELRDIEQNGLLQSLKPTSSVVLSKDKFSGHDVKHIKRQISKLKSSGLTPQKYSNKPNANKVLAVLYNKYQNSLKDAHLIDFDDCLLNCHILLTKINCLNYIKHVLVDEFQDTNSLQLDLMYNFAFSKQNVTVVGDPDQSIYGFRDAVTANFGSMVKKYPEATQISLTENYRSTKDVLNLSEKIMRQQEGRTVKCLKSQLAKSFPPVFQSLSSNIFEAEYIAQQIAYLKQPPDLFKYSDIAILVRSSYQTRAIEHELIKMRIPYDIVKGRAFWERKEVLGILDYLRVVASDKDKLAFIRTLNYPKRGIGEKSMKIIEGLFFNTSDAMTALKSLSIGKNNLSRKSLKGISEYVSFIESARNYMISPDTISLGDLFDYVYERSGLKHEFQEDPDKELNIMEVRSQILEFSPSDESLPLFEGASASDVAVDSRNIIEKFLASVDLYESDNQKNINKEESITESSGKVCISTIHGSKGLEWPVVFVPGLSETLLPASFAIKSEDDIDEERRCFYVATTRSKILLYITNYVENFQDVNYALSYNRGVDTPSRFVGPIAKLTEQKQKAFNDINTIKALYELNSSQVPSNTEFDFFLKNYRSDTKLTPYDKFMNKANNLVSFTSARLLTKTNFNISTENATECSSIVAHTASQNRKENCQSFLQFKSESAPADKSSNSKLTTMGFRSALSNGLHIDRTNAITSGTISASPEHGTLIRKPGKYLGVKRRRHF